MRQCAPLGIRYHVLDCRDWQALAHATSFVDLFVIARRKRDPLDHFLHIFRNMQPRAIALNPGFLRGDRDAFFHRRRIVGANLRPDTVLQRRNDLAARGVVLRVRTEHNRDIERQADRISLNLHVAFLHDVEESDLNLAREIRQLVNCKNSTIGARQQPIMHGEFAG